MAHQVISGATELPRGAEFVVLPAPIKRGDLALFEFNKTTIIGRWFPDIGGCDWILQPERRIRVGPESAGELRVLGVVIPCEEPPKQITDLPDAGRFLSNPFPRRLGE